MLFIPLVFIACNKNHDVPPPPEMLIIDSVMTITTNDNGFASFNAPANRGNNWLGPYDFYNGTFQCRYEILQYPSQKTFLINLCIWSDVVENWENYRETCSKQVTINGKGVFTSQSSPSSWWKLDEPVDFSRVDDFYNMGIILWCENYQNLSYGEDCWNQRYDFLPLTIRLTVVAVAKGYTFSGWENYIN
jgi:hypothetical protein